MAFKAEKIPRARPDEPRTYLCKKADWRARRIAKREHKRLIRRAGKRWLDDAPKRMWGGYLD